MHSAVVSPCLAILSMAAALMLLGPADVRGGLISIIQKNVLGTAEFHRQQPWPFDPDVSARRYAEFVALHGDKSERLIERIGLGTDGRQNERREQQMVRDYLYDRQQRQQNDYAPPVSGSYQPTGGVRFPPGYAAR